MPLTRIKIRRGALALATASLLAFASSAAAAPAEEARIGAECAGTAQSWEAETAFQNETYGLSGYSVRAPWAGVVTSWTVRVQQQRAPFSLALAVLVRLGETNRYMVTQESAPVTVKTGEVTTQARIPVEKSEAVGLTGIGTPVPYCETTHPALNNIASALKSIRKGEIGTFGYVAGYIPVEAILERDGDGDGFGDVSQDRCPRGAAVHARNCPRVEVEVRPRLRDGTVVVRVDTSSAAPVEVAATVRVPGVRSDGSAATLRPKGARGRVAGASPRSFRLDLTASQQRLLALMPAGRAATVRASVVATDLAGARSRAVGRAKFRG